MRLVVDANIMFAALLRDGLTRQLWFSSKVELWAPRHLLVELSKHRSFLEKKSGETNEQVTKVLNLLLTRVQLLNDDTLEPFGKRVRLLIADEADWAYLACALATAADVWSNDNGFQSQTEVKTWKTTELAKELGLLKQ